MPGSPEPQGHAPARAGESRRRPSHGAQNPMDHLSDERLLQLHLDEQALLPPEEAHLESCPTCQTLYAQYAALAEDLALARRSRPSAQALARYYRLFQEIPRSSLAQRVERALRAVILGLGFDSRQQAALGVRRAAEGLGYRLLFSGDQADLELYVEPTGDTRRLEGALILGEDLGIEGPFWVELRPIPEGAPSPYPAQESSRPVAVTLSRPDGYFRIRDVRPGRYRLALTPTRGAVLAPWLEVESIHIT